MKKKVDSLLSKPQSNWTEEDKKMISLIRGLKHTA